MINKVPQVTYIYDRYKKASSNTKAAIEMRITYDKKQKYISTGIFIYSNQWKNGKVINCGFAIQLNSVLDKMLIDVNQIIYEMISENNVDIFSIPTKLRAKKNANITFISFCEQRAAIRKYEKAEDTKARYDRFLDTFKKWGKITSFSDVTDINIVAYDQHLKSTGMKSYSKWQNYHRFLNSFIMDAIEEGLLQRNPYKWVNIENSEDSYVLQKYLTPEEFKKIKGAIMITESLERVRDLFIFQTYTCLAYSELKNFDITSIKKVKGMKVYTGRRQKTGKTFTIPLLPDALRILSKYQDTLPIISNAKYNEYLKIVAQAAGIDKPISSHWARHTGATLLLNEGVDMKIISQICGHSSTRITERIYAKILDETVVDAVYKVEI